MTTIIAFIIIFGILVIVHEFGHYFFAKRSGILVREFSVGMGPKLLAFRRNNTTYTLRLLPLGGYVRMAGWQDEDDEIKPGTQLTLETNPTGEVTRINTSDKVTLQGGIPVQVSHVDLVNDLVVEGYENGDESELKTWHVNHDATIIESDGTEVVIAPADVQFQNASIGKRIMTNFAGPMNNFILAILAFMVVGFMTGVQQLDSNAVQVVASEPAAKAGLKTNDHITAINGKKMKDYNAILTALSKKQKSVTLTIAQGKQDKTLTVKPTKDGKIGVMPIVDHSPMAAIKYGFTQTWFMGTRILSELKSMVTGGFSLNKLAGPVGIYTMTSQFASQGFISLVFFLGFLSVNLGIINLVPIPMLDGGKIVINLIELVRGKPLPREREGVITLIGVGIMVALMVAVTINDIMRIF
ncbi:RIP metalloprotease RseP [Lacticaseibacillus saniviri]|uniref:Zinc metalloprotease n=2 Tax=Lacticaseibacillus saniviri TaxID=931533 RepID=A0A0R2MYH4_9LACO|nr:RIP metalloprotease RseP [Lacticaseibacillus saniviri]KRO18631.1 membrane-associated Zn-dependent protease 1 [Lacticaseibacillus saniviri JCM 17471 = DSM 24301]